MQPEERDAAYLWDMLSAAREVTQIAGALSLEEFKRDTVKVRATERCVEIIGEAARHVSKTYQESHPNIPWAEIVGQRNILAHEYGQIDHEILHKTVTDDIPQRSCQRSERKLVLPNATWRAAMPIFEHASKPVAEYRDWDPRIPEVVRSLPSAVQPMPEGVTLEHVGSTAVPGCGGKGVVDLLALYPDGALEETKAWLLGLGLGKQGPEFSRPWGEHRPMYLGGYRYSDEVFVVYVHVVRAASDEVRRFRAFRELLLGRPDLVAEYCRVKRKIVVAGVTDTDEYGVRKRPFMRRALGDAHSLRDE